MVAENDICEGRRVKLNGEPAMPIPVVTPHVEIVLRVALAVLCARAQHKRVVPKPGHVRRQVSLRFTPTLRGDVVSEPTPILRMMRPNVFEQVDVVAEVGLEKSVWIEGIVEQRDPDESHILVLQYIEAETCIAVEPGDADWRGDHEKPRHGGRGLKAGGRRCTSDLRPEVVRQPALSSRLPRRYGVVRRLAGRAGISAAAARGRAGPAGSASR